ncbi:hypothetical protein C1Y40_03293 [Mycobacterium talmoniae]|uniref:Uncharacterized protein n=1 Tax=Mycobacterium talmoniae TaxID=1858794 RepID=A0A2S8BIV1_9MYCO|nr:hypothetical protein C1Y40_03293 [Mycobacterium talmoniae]
MKLKRRRESASNYLRVFNLAVRRPSEAGQNASSTTNAAAQPAATTASATQSARLGADG